MKKNPQINRLLELNLALLLISTSGALGRYIHMPPPLTIWWRCVFAAVFIALFCWLRGVKFHIHHKGDVPAISAAGLLLGGHWVTYFFSLQYSNVAIGMLSLFTFPVMTTFLEPFILKTKFQLSHIYLAILVTIGIYFLAPSLDLKNDYTKGIIFGLASALMYALRNILLKNKASRYHSSALMFYQLLIISIALTPAVFIYDAGFFHEEWQWIITLALFTTAIGHTLFVTSLNHFSVSSVSIISSAQPIYGIILGVIFLNEVPSLQTGVGGALILMTVFIESWRSSRKK